jgi:oligopeptide/dipeptide ABC transporter ATP-binding protein
MGYLLQVKNIRVEFKNKKRSFTAINDVDFHLKQGEILGIVGESGSGKSLTALSILQLFPEKAQVTSGEILFENQDLLKLKKGEIERYRGQKISMIFQDPMVALDPVYKCGHQIVETIVQHEKVTKKAAHDRALSLLKQVGIPHPKRYMNAYPYELSGGMCQRVMIVIALSCRPKLLIADEPTTALDVTVQAQILDLLRNLRKETGMGIIFITHDIGVIAEIADNTAIMYAGEVMEEGKTEHILNNPLHPYTKGLIMSVPQLDSRPDKPLKNIPGVVPGLKDMPIGCRFNTRCPLSDSECRTLPKRICIDDSHWIRCHKVSAEEYKSNE